MAFAERRDEEERRGSGGWLGNLFGGSANDNADPDARSLEELRARLIAPPEVPSWGPHGVRSRLAQLFRALRIPHGLRERLPAALRGKQQNEHEQIVENLELHRKIFNYRWYYFFTAIASLLIALGALYVDYHIIQADVWTRALSDEFGVVPAAMQESVIFKSLQVVFATLAIHFMLKITGDVGRYIMVVLVFVLSFVMVAGLGFIVANNNLAAGASGLKSLESDGNQLGDALTQLGLAAGPAQPEAATPSTEARPQFVEKTAERCPRGYQVYPDDNTLCRLNGAAAEAPLVNLNLQDWFVFRSLPEEWRKNAQINLWLVFASLIFFVITAIAALYLESAERNVRNFVEARDYLNRAADYRHYRRMVASAED